MGWTPTADTEASQWNGKSIMAIIQKTCKCFINPKSSIEREYAHRRSRSNREKHDLQFWCKNDVPLPKNSICDDPPQTSEHLKMSGIKWDPCNPL